jgi:hypothetical protein
MKIDAWFQAQVVCPPIICGIQLKSFSLGHEFILRHLENPFIVGGHKTREALFQGLHVCSRSFRDACLFLNAENVSFIHLKWWAWKWNKIDLSTAGESFTQYISNFTEFADRWVEEDKQQDAKKRANVPWEYHLHRILCEVYGCQIDQAWDVPLSQAHCYFDCWAESNGDRSLVSEHEQEIILKVI